MIDKDSLPLDKPRRTPGHPTKSHVVKTRVDGKEKIIRFGEQGASTAGKPKEGESEAMKQKRASFKARHAQNIAKGKSSPAYWADKVKWKTGGSVELEDLDEKYEGIKKPDFSLLESFRELIRTLQERAEDSGTQEFDPVRALGRSGAAGSLEDLYEAYSDKPVPHAARVEAGAKDPKRTETAKMVFDSFKNAGFSDAQAKALTAEINREGSFNPAYLYGSHTDAANRATNVGMLSWQGDRADRLMSFMADRGLIDPAGRITPGQAALNAQAEYLRSEMENDPSYAATRETFLANPNIDQETAHNILGKNFIRWRIDDPKYRGSGFDRISEGYDLLNMAQGYAEGGLAELDHKYKRGGKKKDDELARSSMLADLELMAQPKNPKAVPAEDPRLLNVGGLEERLALLNQTFNPVEAIGGAMRAGREMMDPEAGGYDRLAALGNMLSGVAGVAGPAAVAKRVGAPAATALMESLLGASPTAEAVGDTMRAVGRDVVDRLNQPGPMPTTYANPIPGLLGASPTAEALADMGRKYAVDEAGSLPGMGRGRAPLDVSRRDASNIFGEGSERVRYTDPQSNGTIEVVVRPDGSASVLELEVPEASRGQGIGQTLQDRVMQDFPVMGGQVSSKAAATTAYRLGRRPPGKPDATLEEVFADIDEMSSVNMVSPAMQERLAPAAPVDTSYRMQHQPRGPQDDLPIRLDDLTKSTTGEQAGYPADFYSANGPRFYAPGPQFSGDEFGQANRESYRAIMAVRGKPDAEVTIYRAVPNDPNITTINEGDFVTLSPTYAKLHAASGYGRSGDDSGKIISQKVKVRDIYFDGNDVNEFGFFPVTPTRSSVQDLDQKYAEGGEVNTDDELERATLLRDLELMAQERSPDAVPAQGPSLMNIGGIGDRLALINKYLNPVEVIGESMDAGSRMMSPGVSGYDRVAALGDMLSGVAGVAGPMAVAKRVGAPAASAVMEGLLGGSPTSEALADMGRKYAVDESGALKLYHGSPHDFDRFSMSKLGTGEGAQAYGRGLYFAENEGVARGYRDTLSPSLIAVDGRIVESPVTRAAARFSPSPDDYIKVLMEKRDRIAKNIESAVSDPELDDMMADIYRDIYRSDIADIDAKIAELQPLSGGWFSTKPGGRMYEVNVNANPEDFLDWDLPLSEQPIAVQNALAPMVTSRLDALEAAGQRGRQMAAEKGLPDFTPKSRETLYGQMRVGDIIGASRLGQFEGRAEDILSEAGIPGIRYLDAGSRGAGDGSRNYVVFDENLINIVRKYGIAGAAAALGVSQAEVAQAMGQGGASQYDPDAIETTATRVRENKFAAGGAVKYDPAAVDGIINKLREVNRG